MLWAELAIIRPKLVILLGAVAIQHFHGRHFNVTKARGSVLPYTLAVPELDEDGNVVLVNKLISTFATMHPAAVAREPSMRPGLSKDLSKCSNIMRGTSCKAMPTSHSVLRTVADVRNHVGDLLRDGYTKFAIDCEWSGKSPHANGTLLTMQISHALGVSACIVFNRHPRQPCPLYDNADMEDYDVQHGVITFRKPSVTETLVRNLDYVDEDGKPALGLVHELPDGTKEIEVLNVLIPNFKPEEDDEVRELLKQLLLRPEVRVGGHNLRADYPWLKALGLDLSHQFRHGFDTMLRHHMLFESAKQDLSSLVLKYTDVARYDLDIQEWAALLKVDKAVTGYGHIPEHILYPYANYDADCTFRIDVKLDEEFANNRNEDRIALGARVYAEMGACMGILEIEEVGLLCDRERLDELAVKYAEKRKELLKNLQGKIHWPNFNFRSVQHVRELLFGEQFNGKKRQNPMIPERIRPPTAYCCHLVPIKTTDKPPMNWDKVIQYGLTAQKSPSTDKESLGILSAQDDVANALRQMRFVDQVVKNFTSLPRYDSVSGEFVEAGLAQHIDPDGRIRTSIFQGTETGRWSSSRPNLQNLPKRREPELHALFDEDTEGKPHKIRSIFMAPPGHVLIESDYQQAELVVLALLSGDQHFWDVLMEQKPVPVLVDVTTGEPYRWLHPDYSRNCPVKVGDFISSGTQWGEYKGSDGAWHVFATGKDTRVETRPWPRDLHAERAISGFQMPYSAVLHGPPKDFVEGYAKEKRVAAKTVNFGIPYGRSAGAIARELKQDGVDVDVRACQAMIDGFYEDFSLVELFLKRCRECVRNPGYLINPHGRRRRFEDVDDDAKMAAQEREACNFPIQSTVAECLNDAVYNCWLYRRCADAARRNPEHPLASRFPWVDFRIALGVHDALIFEAPAESVHEMCRPGGVIDFCMSTTATVPLPKSLVCRNLYGNIDSSKFPYAISVDKGVFLRWDEKPHPKKEPEAARALRDKMAEIGVPGPYLPKVA